jgi:hypothetical protein
MLRWILWSLAIWIVPQVLVVLAGYVASCLGAFASATDKERQRVLQPALRACHSSRPPPKHPSFPPVPTRAAARRAVKASRAKR